MNNRPVISFCIPTYKRAKVVYKCVRNILEYKLHEIEVVISHDYTEGDLTEELLLSLNDKRIKYFRFEERQGISKSIKTIMDKATGEYSCLLSDEDIVNLDTIPKLISKIKENCDLSIIYCSTLKKTNGKLVDYYKFSDKLLTGNDAVRAIAFNHSYIGGVIYNTDIFNDNFKNNDTWHMKDELYPFEYPMLILAIKGKVLLSSDILLTAVDEGNITFIKSIDNKHPYSYECRLKTFEQRAVILDETISDYKLKEELVLLQFKTFLMAATIVYFKIVKDLNKRPMDGIEKIKLNKRALINNFCIESTKFLNSIHFDFSQQGEKKIATEIRKIKILSLFESLLDTKFYVMCVRAKNAILSQTKN